MPVNDDAGRAFFPIRQFSVAIGIKHFENLAVSLAALAILEYLHLHAGRILVPQVGGELHFLMNRVVVPHESPDKSNHDDSRRRRR